MNAEYPAIYRDAHGDEKTTIRNDGQSIEMTVRGVAFSGWTLDDFEPDAPADSPALSSFTLNCIAGGTAELCGCSLEFQMPLPVITPQGEVEALLDVHMELGFPAAGGGIDREEFHLTLHLGGVEYASSGTSGWMEDELLQIQRSLPEGSYMRACINCAFSDYSVYGHSAFGGMFCFRGVKSAYQSVKTKAEYMALDRFTERVQETYLCPEFERRRPGSGYRG